jgi:choline dehydrogenase-like flavoprotein
MAVIEASTLKADQSLVCDVVVVGTGAGGGMMARELAEAGVDVIAIEMGANHKPKDFNQLEDEMFERLFQQRGAQATVDMKIRVISGIGVGGSTVHNTNLCRRTPAALLQRWQKEHQVSGALAADLKGAFEKTERELNVKTMGPSELNRGNELFKKGINKLGYKGGFLAHNRMNCQRSGFCELGCAYDAKQNSAKVLIPKALEMGARVYSGFRAERILQEKGRAAGVAGSVVDTATGKRRLSFTIKARAVCVAGSAIRSPALLQASEILDEAGMTGKNFRCHPGVIAAGVFDEVVDGWRGIPQSYECTQLLDHNDDQKNIWMVPGFAHPIGTAAMAPGFGATHMSFMRKYRHMAAIIVMLDEEGSGSVKWRGNGRIDIRHSLTALDRKQIVMGLEGASKILLAAGAKEVLIPHHDPLVIKGEDQLGLIKKRGVPDYDLALTGVHPMGTLKMGDNPKSAVVKSTGEHHGLPGLFICDGSVFPTALGVPPQISIYSFSRHFAPHVLSFLKG